MTQALRRVDPLGDATEAVVHEMLLRGLSRTDMAHVLAGALIGILMSEPDRQLRGELAAAAVHCLGHAVVAP